MVCGQHGLVVLAPKFRMVEEEGHWIKLIPNSILVFALPPGKNGRGQAGKILAVPDKVRLIFILVFLL